MNIRKCIYHKLRDMQSQVVGTDMVLRRREANVWNHNEDITDA